LTPKTSIKGGEKRMNIKLSKEIKIAGMLIIAVLILSGIALSFAQGGPPEEPGQPTIGLLSEIQALEDKLDAVNAVQLYSDYAYWETDSVGSYTVMQVWASKAVKVTITYFAVFSDADDFARVTIYAMGDHTLYGFPVDGTKSQYPNAPGYITKTVAAQFLEIDGYNYDGNIRIWWFATVEASPDTRVEIRVL
jgi:hypothetical protein